MKTDKRLTYTVGGDEDGRQGGMIVVQSINPVDAACVPSKLKR